MSWLDPATVVRHRWRNLAQAALLLAGMSLLVGGVAWLLVGPVGLVWLTVVGAASLGWRSRASRGAALQALGAQPLSPRRAPQLYAWMQELAGRAGLAGIPRLYRVPTAAPTAMAVGHRDDAGIVVTDGLLGRLTSRELVGVLAHEVSHVRSNDVWVMTLSEVLASFAQTFAWVGLATLLLAAPLAGATAWPALLGLVLASLPTVVALLQLALARAREFDADLAAATLTSDPEGLASALQRLDAHEGRSWERVMASRRRAPDLSLLRTHPPTERRVERLQQLARRPGSRVGRPHRLEVRRPPGW